MIGDEKASNIIGVIKSNAENCMLGSTGWNVVTKIKPDSPGGSSFSGSNSTY